MLVMVMGGMCRERRGKWRRGHPSIVTAFDYTSLETTIRTVPAKEWLRGGLLDQGRGCLVSFHVLSSVASLSLVNALLLERGGGRNVRPDLGGDNAQRGGVWNTPINRD